MTNLPQEVWKIMYSGNRWTSHLLSGSQISRSVDKGTGNEITSLVSWILQKFASTVSPWSRSHVKWKPDSVAESKPC